MGSWSKPIPLIYIKFELKHALLEIDGVNNVSVSKSELDLWGSIVYDVSFPHYFGSPPFGEITEAAGDIPEIEVELSNLVNDAISVEVVTVENDSKI